MDEVHRSATFLLAYGAADAKLTEVVAAIDKRQFAPPRGSPRKPNAPRSRRPSRKPGEDWEPEARRGDLPQPLSFERRRKVKVSTITELTGTRTYLPDGFERFYELSRPTDGRNRPDLVRFRDARNQATRKRTYQQRFVLPMLRARIRTGLGDLPGAVDAYAQVTGFFIGIGMIGTPAGMVRHPDSGPGEARGRGSPALERPARGSPLHRATDVRRGPQLLEP